MTINFSDPSLTRVFDRNGDGSVTRKELKQVLGADGNKKDLTTKDLDAIGITDTETQTSIINSYKEHKSETNLFSFLKPNSNQNTNNVVPEKPANDSTGLFGGLFNNTSNVSNSNSNQPSNDGFLKFNKDVSSFQMTQYNGSLSEGGDCGPTSGAMVLKAFGVDTSIADVRRNSTGKQVTSKTRPNEGNWALDSRQLSSSINKTSNGQVSQSGKTQTYTANADGKAKLVADIKASLEKGELPILCTGTDDPSFKYRHYVVVTGVDNNGNIQIADPANTVVRDGKNGDGAPARSISADELFGRMQNASKHGKITELMSFRKN